MLFNGDISVYVTYILAGMTLLLSIAILLLTRRVHMLYGGKDTAEHKKALHELSKEKDIMAQKIQAAEERSKYLDKKISTSVRGVGTVRFNAFSEVGGKQSFATAIVDGIGNGVMLTSIYGRDRATMYAKPLVSFSSDFDLSPEEQNAIHEAKERLT